MADQQLTWMANIEVILRNACPACCSGETVTLDTTHADLWPHLYRTGYAAQFTVSPAEAKKEWQATLAGDFGPLWFEASPQYFIDGNLVGSLMTVTHAPWDDTPRCPFVIELVVAPAYRRQGIGARLLASAAEICRQNGETHLALRVMNSNSAAKSLYKKLGFVPWQNAADR
ncbi:GNAT family N-acetyltransferase [bacterium]|nr:GNAT family N-acetyltransferase [bacterium]